MDGAGGISYFSSGSWKRPVGGVCPEAVASEARKINRLLVETVEDLILDYVVFASLRRGAVESWKRFTTVQSRTTSLVLLLIQNAELVEIYL